MKKEIKVWAITSIAFWLLAPNITNAQQDSLQSKVLDEIVTTATKFPKSQSETGKVLTIIDEAQLEQSAGKTVSQLLNEQVGIVINGANSNPGKDKAVYLRGANTQYTLIVVDGIPMIDPSGFGGAFDLRLIPVDQIARIEILKGSQSTLYGSDAIAGVINIITKKAGDKKLGGSASVNYGSYNSFKGTAGINGRTKAVEYNVSYTRYATEGISEAKDIMRTGTFDKDGFTQNAFQMNLGVQPVKSLKLKPFIRYNDFDGRYDAGSFIDDPNARYTSNVLNPGVTGSYQLKKGAVNFTYGFNRVKRTFEDSYGSTPFDGRFSSTEIFANYDIGSKVQVLGGLSYQHIKMMDTTAVEENPDVNIASPYASFLLHNMNGFNLELGGRYNNHSKYGSNFTYSFNPAYLINQKIKLFFNYSTGFKAPTLYQLFGKYGANPNLKPELSNSIEGGVQLLLANNKVELRGVAFGRKIEDVIQYTYNGGYFNLDKQHDHGFEFEGSFQPASKVTLKFFYTYVTGKIITRAGENDTTYFNLIRRPKHTVGLNVVYQVIPQLMVSANVKTFSKRMDQYYDVDFIEHNITLDSYALLDLYAEYKFYKQHFSVFVDAKNIFNQDYYEVYGYATMGTNINAGLSFKF